MNTLSRINTLAFILLTTVISISAKAQFDGEIQYRGNGCPQGSVNASFTQDGGIASLIFDSYSAQTNDKKWSDFKYCTVQLGVDIPKGYRISKVKAEVNGFMSVPIKSFGTVLGQVYAKDKDNKVLLNNYNYIGFNKPYQDNVSFQIEAKATKINKCPKRKEKVYLYTYIDLWVPQYKSYSAFGVIDTVDTSLISRHPTSYSAFLEPCSH